MNNSRPPKLLVANRLFIGYAQNTRNKFQHTITDLARQLDTTGYLIPSAPETPPTRHP